MPQNIVQQNRYTLPITVPVDGDPVNFAQREPSLQALADQSLWNKGKAQMMQNLLLGSMRQAWTIDDGTNGTVIKSYTTGAYSPTLKRLVALGVQTGNAFAYSDDGGSIWTNIAPPQQGWSKVIWVAALSLYVAVCSSGASRIFTSPDGITWTARTATAVGYQSIACSPAGVLVAVALNTATGQRSTNGTTWADVTLPASQQWVDVVWAQELSLFVAVSQSGAGGRVATSPDGIAWTLQSAGVDANDWQDICWSAELGLLVATCTTGTNRVMTSPDGVNWTGRNVGTLSFNDVVCCPELGVLVGVNSSGGFYTSLDAINWVSNTIATGGSELVWVPELSALYVIAGATVSRTVAASGGDGISNAGTSSAWTTNVVQNLVSSVLGPGDWEVWGSVHFPATAGITGTGCFAAISTVSANDGAPGDEGRADLPLVPTTSTGVTVVTPRRRIKVPKGTTTTVYLTGRTVFSAGTPAAGLGKMVARKFGSLGSF